jgi:ABC-type multidrug transport system fused ATPase/permease subunit
VLIITGIGVSATIDDDIIAAAKASNAHDFIMSFPNQYDTDVGESSMMV